MGKARAIDVARFILEDRGSMSAMKLQKLVYYSQAWSLVWDDCELFVDRIEAWSNGPVVTSLYSSHKGKFQVSASDFSSGDPSRLSNVQKDTVRTVLKSYGNKSAQWLSDQTHLERPWIEARKELAHLERGHHEISSEKIAEYFSSLR